MVKGNHYGKKSGLYYGILVDFEGYFSGGIQAGNLEATTGLGGQGGLLLKPLTVAEVTMRVDHMLGQINPEIVPLFLSGQIETPPKKANGIPRREFIKKGLAGIAFLLLGTNGLAEELVLKPGTQKAYFLFQKHVDPQAVTLWFEQLTDMELALVIAFMNGYKNLHNKFGEEWKEHLSNYSELDPKEYEKLHIRYEGMLSRYRMRVLMILDENYSLIKKHRQEIEAIKKAITKYGLTKIGLELTPEELEKEKRQAKEQREQIITWLKGAEVKDYAQKADDLFLMLVGPAIYLFTTGYAPFINGEIELIGLESSQIKKQASQLVDAFSEAAEKVLKIRPDIKEEWDILKNKINNNGRLLSYYEIDE